MERATSGRSKIQQPGQSGDRHTNVRNIGTFVDVLARLMDGYPVGAAMESINRRYVELASELASEPLAGIGVTETTELEDSRRVSRPMRHGTSWSSATRQRAS